MKERIANVIVIFAWMCAYATAGAIAIYATTWVVPMAQAVHESHGLVGFLYGFVFCIGLAVFHTLRWVIKGGDFIP